MKIEYLIRAPYNGIIKKVNFKEKDQIEIDQNTIELKKNWVDYMDIIESNINTSNKDFKENQF